VSAIRIDAHQHFWAIGANGHSWPGPDLPAIHRDFLPDDLAPLLDGAGIAASVLVQSQPNDADTDWLLTLAEATPRVAAVVGWVDVKAANAASRIAALAARPKLRGFRPMLQDLPAGWILDPAAADALAAMEQHRLVFDALIRPAHLGDIAVLATRHPDLRIVVDHAAKPVIAGGTGIAAWARDLTALARTPNVQCKLSGLVTEAAADWRPDDLREIVTQLVQSFGPARLLWGSDWPVVLLASDYRRWFDTAQTLLAGLSEADRAAVFGGNAAALYGIELEARAA
jgi:L-fuconolactonase